MNDLSFSPSAPSQVTDARLVNSGFAYLLYSLAGDANLPQPAGEVPRSEPGRCDQPHDFQANGPRHPISNPAGKDINFWRTLLNLIKRDRSNLVDSYISWYENQLQCEPGCVKPYDYAPRGSLIVHLEPVGEPLCSAEGNTSSKYIYLEAVGTVSNPVLNPIGDCKSAGTDLINQLQREIDQLKNSSCPGDCGVSVKVSDLDQLLLSTPGVGVHCKIAVRGTLEVTCTGANGEQDYELWVEYKNRIYCKPAGSGSY